MTENSNARLEEVLDPASPHIAGMTHVLHELFPEFTPLFGRILSERTNEDGRIAKQLFAGLCGNTVAGLLQIFYHLWRDGLVGIVDLVGVLESHRHTGLGLRMMRASLPAVREAAASWGVPAKGLVWATEPDEGPEDSWRVRRVRMYERIGGQARRDFLYRYDGQPEPDGEIILWYPLSDDVADVSTRELAWFLWQSGGLPRKQFTKRYGDPIDVERVDPPDR